MGVQKLKEIVSPLLNEDALIKMLQKSSGYKIIKFKDVEISPQGANKGDSYLSSIVRFTIYGAGKNSNDEIDKDIKVPVIVKYMPKNVGRLKTFRSTDFFKNEIEFYNRMYEAMLKFQESKNVTEKFNSIPVCLYALTDGINDFIAMEDLNAQSFTSVQRQGEMDYETVIYIVKLFAKFHALSYAFKNQHPEEFNEIVDHMLETYFHERHRSWYEPFHKLVIKVSRDAVSKELPESYLRKFDYAVENDLYRQFIRVAANRHDPLAVITQGDAWIPNFLVKYDENNHFKDARIIDFQLSRCCPGPADVSFFLYSSSNYDFYNTNWDQIYREYLTVFKNQVAELGSDPSPFTEEAFKESIKNNSIVCLAMAMECFPFQVMDNSDCPDLDKIEGTEAIPISEVWKIKPLETKVARQKLAFMLKHAIDHGFM